MGKLLGLYDVRFSVSIIYAAFITALLIVDMTGMVAYSIAAAYLHEMGHIAAMTALSEPPRNISLRFRSAQIMDKGSLNNYGRDIVIHFAGPLVNFALCFALIKINPMFSMISLILGAFNMLPIKQLDGGNMLLCFMCAIMSRNAAGVIAAVVSWICIIPIAILGIIVFINTGYANITLLVAAVYLITLNL